MKQVRSVDMTYISSASQFVNIFFIYFTLSNVRTNLL